MQTRRILVAAAILAAVVAIFAWAFAPRPVAVETAEALSTRFEQTVDEEGRLRVRERYTIGAPVAGRVERIALKVGDAVEANQVVAQLFPAPAILLDLRTVAGLRERVEAADASLLRAKANLARAKAALEQAQFDLERTRKLAERGFAAKAAEDQARLVVAQQEQAVRAAEFETDAAGHELGVAKAALQRSQPDAGGARRTPWELRSPVAGRVLKVVQESEATVPTGAPLIEVGDPSSLEAVVEVLSQDATRIRPGAKVSMMASPQARPIVGRVFRVEPVAHTKISTLGVEEQRVNVIVALDEPPSREIGDGYRVDASIVTMERESATVVPIGAVFRDGEGWATFVAKGDRASKRAVTLGARSTRVAWIERGIEPGERVIVYPPDTVSDGVRIDARDGARR